MTDANAGREAIARDCHHGQHARQCNICELERERDELRAELAQQDEWRTGPTVAEIAALKARLASAERVVEAAMAMLPYFTSGNDVPVREVRLHIDLPFVAEFVAALRSHDAERGEGGEGTDG